MPIEDNDLPVNVFSYESEVSGQDTRDDVLYYDEYIIDIDASDSWRVLYVREIDSGAFLSKFKKFFN